MGGAKTKFYGNNSCTSKLQSQHSAENLAGIEGKSLYVNKGNVNVNKSYW